MDLCGVLPPFFFDYFDIFVRSFCIGYLLPDALASLVTQDIGVELLGGGIQLLGVNA